MTKPSFPIASTVLPGKMMVAAGLPPAAAIISRRILLSRRY
jgi:hypothetical protein